MLVLYKKHWAMLECKRSASAPFQPGQKEWLETLGKWSFVRVVFPENFDIIKVEISKFMGIE